MIARLRRKGSVSSRPLVIRESLGGGRERVHLVGDLPVVPGDAVERDRQARQNVRAGLRRRDRQPRPADPFDRMLLRHYRKLYGMHDQLSRDAFNAAVEIERRRLAAAAAVEIRL